MGRGAGERGFITGEKGGL